MSMCLQTWLDSWVRAFGSPATQCNTRASRKPILVYLPNLPSFKYLFFFFPFYGKTLFCCGTWERSSKQRLTRKRSTWIWEKKSKRQNCSTHTNWMKNPSFWGCLSSTAMVCAVSFHLDIENWIAANAKRRMQLQLCAWV